MLLPICAFAGGPIPLYDGFGPRNWKLQLRELGLALNIMAGAAQATLLAV